MMEQLRNQTLSMEKRQELAETSETIEEILQAGAAKASELANQTLEKARELCKLTGKRVP